MAASKKKPQMPKAKARALTSSEKVWVKVYKNPSGFLVAACDQELIGKVFDREVSPGQSIPFLVTPRFYQGELKTLQELGDALETSSQANLVGEKIVRFLLARKIISQKAVIMVGKVPHVVLMKI